MCDLSKYRFVEVKELSDAEQATKLLNDERWKLIAAAPGQDSEKRPLVLYSLGRLYTEPEGEWI